MGSSTVIQILSVSLNIRVMYPVLLGTAALITNCKQTKNNEDGVSSRAKFLCENPQNRRLTWNARLRADYFTMGNLKSESPLQAVQNALKKLIKLHKSSLN
jgi:hypothetical protein